jgi:hypothetical protein
MINQKDAHTLFQIIMQPSIDVDMTFRELLVIDFAPSSVTDGRLAIQVTRAVCLEKLPRSSPVFDDIA